MELRFDYADDDSLTGFRLDTFEFYNWGTFDKSIFKLNFDKQNALLTGDIGSGKSTIVDALTSLLVPHQKIVYNKAAGAEGKERSLYSYIVGEYKSSKDENFGSSKAVCLRDATNFSVLLANFKNDGFDESITLAQFFYITNNQVNKFFITSQSNLSIKKDFFNFENIRGLKKRLKKLPHTNIYESFTDYSKDFKRFMGIKNDQALNLFYQTVSMKAIGNLTSFIRNHMLENSNIDKQIDELCHNFSELNHSHNLILRAKRQIELLTPIDKDGKKYEVNCEQRDSLQEIRDTLSAYFAFVKQELLNTKLKELRVEFQKVISNKKRANEDVEYLNNSIVDIKIELQKNGADRLSSIEKEIEQTEKSLNEKKEQNSKYNQLAKLLELPTVSNEHRFLNNKDDAADRLEDIQNQTDKIQNEIVFDNVSLQKYKRNIQELDAEIIYLKNNRSNIPQRVSKIRDDMAKSLKINSEKLPFVGELVRVNDKSWEGAIQRVLYSFSLCLLVDDDFYDEVSRYVEETNLKGKLVYLKVNTAKKVKNFIEIPQNSLVNKIEVKADSFLFETVNDMLGEKFNIPCVKNMTEFKRYKKALSINGQYKANLMRHEKDDRFDIKDKSRWTLGWDNIEKLQQIEQDYNLLDEKIKFLDDKILKSKKQQKNITSTRDNLRDILKFSLFENIDWYIYSKKIDLLQEEKKTLQESSNIIFTLKEKLQAVEIKYIEKKDKFEELSQKMGSLDTNIQTRQSELNEATLLVQNSENLDRLSESIKDFVDDNINLNNIKSKEKESRESVQSKLGTLTSKIERNRDSILKSMGLFINEFQVDAKDFDVSINSLSEFRKKLNELKKDDLPKWQKRFKELLKEKMLQHILVLQNRLEHLSNEIKEKIDKINSSLKAIEYSDGTFIELIAQKSKNIEIREFKESLKSAISGSIGDDNSYDENKFLQIKSIIERFNGRQKHSDEDKKWRKVVTDVRNWFDFSASEKYLSDGSEKEYYTDSGGKSGGQKEKLAYTVLASSLAYQFGLEHNEIKSKSFRFVMIDEAFGRGSDESTKYGLRLFEKLNLQLLVITPKQKINVIEPHVKTVHFVHNKDGMDSTTISMSIEDFQKKKES